MKDRLLLSLTFLLLRALTPVGRVEALLRLNRMVDQDLEGEMEKPGEVALAGKGECYVQRTSYHIGTGR